MTRQDEALVRTHLDQLRQVAATHEEYSRDPKNASPTDARQAAERSRRLARLIETGCFGVAEPDEAEAVQLDLLDGERAA